jgi:arginyl-tRNA synthetase
MLNAVRETWKSLIEEMLALYAKEVIGMDVQLPPLAVQTPPKPELGDLAFPLFAYAKMLRTAPPMLASSLKTRLEKVEDRPLGDLLVAGPYLNVRIDTAALATVLSVQLSEQKELYGTNKSMAEKRVTIEFSCPNTNKPLHLGHMRNDSLGESVAAILKANGATVRKVNLINNRGVQYAIDVAYQKFGNGETPQSAHQGDHLVGKYYVMFAQWAKEDLLL